ncbi:hypothetical protein ILYODFUR_030065 [Ilyodon furcidens]|uniref:Uncharacterized protein n=1 Tax=Ilyodon furcidens TaxID=33524 RepID=A0ABV0V7A3_9TELE
MDWSVYVSTFTYSHEIRIMTIRKRSQIQAAEISFLCMVAGVSLRCNVLNFLIVGFELLSRMPPGCLPPHEETPRQTQNLLKELYIPSGLTMPWFFYKSKL